MGPEGNDLIEFELPRGGILKTPTRDTRTLVEVTKDEIVKNLNNEGFVHKVSAVIEINLEEISSEKKEYDAFEYDTGHSIP